MYHTLLHKAILAAIEGGREILEVYDTNFKVSYKADESPVTLADERASDRITEVLQEFNIPVLSEEGEHSDYSIRQHWNRLWIVDPLDGTKEFVKRNGEFTVNIALVEQHEPVIGVIWSPVFKDLYFAAKGLGAFRIDSHTFLTIADTIGTLSLDELIGTAERLPLAQDRQSYRVVASRSHLSKETYAHIQVLNDRYPHVEIVNTGSSIKLCWVAEGRADEYPRFGHTMEWDTAAGHAILSEAGGELIDHETGKTMRYNRPNLQNNWFIARSRR